MNSPESLRGPLIYLAHTEHGESMRALSRKIGVHPSTVLRQVRRVEERRDDPLYDEGLSDLDTMIDPSIHLDCLKELMPMSLTKRVTADDNDAEVGREARRILRRLSESKSFLGVSPDADLGVVFREAVPGRYRQTATVPRNVAREFAIRDWIACTKKGKVACYEITSSGKAALQRMLAEDKLERRRAMAFAETQTPFQMQHQESALRHVMEGDDDSPKQIHVNAAESPLAWLARRPGPDGAPFLSSREMDAGERLREDFEKSAVGPRVAQNWERFMTAGIQSSNVGRTGEGGSQPARDRVASALKSLGPGLSDIAYRCCCFLEGLEAAEKRLGWSKRSGKVVLKIALGRLADHYEGTSISA